MTTALEIAFWASLGLLVYTHVGYPLVLWALARLRRRGAGPTPDARPDVSLVIVAHDEEAVIERKLANALSLDYPRERLELIVASDGSTDATVELAQRAGADLVLDLPRAGKIATQNAAVERARGELLAFSDANAYWRPDALERLVAPFLADERVGYVCGQVRFSADGSANEEGAYWRYEMAVRRLESELGGVTAGNGAIYATRAGSYVALGPSRSHDLSFPFGLTKRGWSARYAPGAVAEEKMVPTIEGEFARKRRMMRGLWDIVVADGMISPRGYGAMYAFEIVSHRLLRYASPLLHLIALGTNIAIVAGDHGLVFTVVLAAQIAFFAAAALGAFVPLRPFRLAYYYATVTLSVALGFWDRMRLGEPAAWEKAEGTR